ncbi:LysR family transcriptional regulator [Vitiosangium sp. GDMCC 1.1324]|uniref:LysR family transcriptional regulator n=1 Tax=Vitiosangium sp. (strain GDMCC 1.1324) TaxID=2138576 RepID=UPI000D3D1039|nr:LysR family transcriptional regulator [Vitiosangium sp. GDMCC 1.1324]PTL85955.1 LysR family transcriptional regulator [Vitiosangium sp. GDMCC 1.1324]
MQSLDLNLLTALDALLQEGSVTGAARRMNLSAPAMSRTLTRIREAVGDPILVRAGRKLVPTPHALALRGRVHEVVEQASGLLRPAGELEPATLDRVFTIRAHDGIAGMFAESLARLFQQEAPRVVTRFVPEGEEDVGALRDGQVDLDVGVIGAMGPEVRLQTLFRDRYAAVVRRGHPILRGRYSFERLAAHPHISISRRGKLRGPLDETLAGMGITRTVSLALPSMYAALVLAAGSDMIVAVPERSSERVCEALGLKTIPLPATLPTVVISQAWHPRFDADGGHRWLRECVRRVCGSEGRRKK